MWPRPELFTALVGRAAAVLDREQCHIERPFACDALIAVSALLRASIIAELDQPPQQTKAEAATALSAPVASRISFSALTCRWCRTRAALLACPKCAGVAAKRRGASGEHTMELLAFCSLRCMRDAHKKCGHTLCASCSAEKSDAETTRRAVAVQTEQL